MEARVKLNSRVLVAGATPGEAGGFDPSTLDADPPMTPGDCAPAVPADSAPAIPSEDAPAIPGDDVLAIPIDDAPAIPSDYSLTIPSDYGLAIPCDERRLSQVMLRLCQMLGVLVVPDDNPATLGGAVRGVDDILTAARPFFAGDTEGCSVSGACHRAAAGGRVAAERARVPRGIIKRRWC